MSQEFAFWHYPHDDTGGAQINGQFPLYDRGHIAEVPDAATRSRWAASSKASLILLFDPAAPEPIGSGTPNTGAFTALTASGTVTIADQTRIASAEVGSLRFGADATHQIRGGYDTAAGYGWLQAANFGTLATSLYLQPRGGSTLIGGNLGIGTTSPISALHVRGSSAFSAGTGTIGVFDSGDATLYFSRTANANVASGDFVIISDGTGLIFGRRAVSEDMKLGTSGGLILGAPTGGNKGSGTLNAVGVYDDNVLLTDLVLDYAEDGAWDREAYAAHPVDSLLQDWMLDPAQYAAAWKRDRHLPLLVSWQDEANRPALGQIVTRQTGELELHAVHIANHEARLAALEVRLAS